MGKGKYKGKYKGKGKGEDRGQGLGFGFFCFFCKMGETRVIGRKKKPV